MPYLLSTLPPRPTQELAPHQLEIEGIRRLTSPLLPLRVLRNADMYGAYVWGYDTEQPRYRMIWVQTAQRWECHYADAYAEAQVEDRPQPDPTEPDPWS